MKKLIYFLMAALVVLAAISCKKDNKTGNNKPVNVVPEEAVDLGIVMTREDGTTYKLYWAKSNLCETGLCANPEDYGDYYAWGEIEPYYTEGHSQDSPCENWRDREDNSVDNSITGYNWSSYKWGDGGSGALLKYNNTYSYGLKDDLTELQRKEKDGETMDDAARYVLGGKWRTPTKAEWEALLEKCDVQWKTVDDGYPHIGCLVTAPSNGNSIFLPAAGCRVAIKTHMVGSYVNYMSSTLYDEKPTRAWILYGEQNVCVQSLDRYYGNSVRPVYEE